MYFHYLLKNEGLVGILPFFVLLWYDEPTCIVCMDLTMCMKEGEEEGEEEGEKGR